MFDADFADSGILLVQAAGLRNIPSDTRSLPLMLLLPLLGAGIAGDPHRIAAGVTNEMPSEPNDCSPRDANVAVLFIGLPLH